MRIAAGFGKGALAMTDLSTGILVFSGLGAFVFGTVVGWITYRTLRRKDGTSLSDIATVVGAVGGAGVTALFPQESGAFAAYCIGLGGGFFGYLVVAYRVESGSAQTSEQSLGQWLGGQITREDGVPTAGQHNPAAGRGTHGGLPPTADPN
jgi:NhaP-type Na+/H+ or K+/H+ antiporter